MKKVIIATTILAIMALAAFAGYDYATRTASVSGYYINNIVANTKSTFIAKYEPTAAWRDKHGDDRKD